MSAVTELGYMTIGVSSLSRWKEFAAEILGLEVVDEGEVGSPGTELEFAL